MKVKYFSYRYLISIIILFTCLFLFSTLSLALIPGDFVGPMGDPTPDGKVDFNDLMVFATAYGSEKGDLNWNGLCDLCGYLGDPNPDDKVNFDDLMIFATNFGKCSPLTYTVTYDGNGNTGGTVPSDANNYEQGDSVTVLGNTGNLVKTGYIFAGWNTQADGNGTDRAVGSTFIMGASNVTLYAQWTINTYTVTFDSQGGSTVSSQTVEHGGKATEPTAPIWAGYTFGGWYEELECTNAWDFVNDTVTSDVTLYAQWTINSYTVTFYSQGGTAVDSQTVAHGGKVTEPTAPTKTGYTFDGWYKESGCTNAWDFDTDTVTSDVTLYAKWTINTYTVTYDGNGSAGGIVPTDANNYEQGDSVTVLGNTGNLVKTQDGISLLFTGWNTAADGSGTSYDAAATFNMGTENVTLYAEWSAIRATGPAGGLIFYDKGSYSDGWRYLEAAPSDQSGPYHAWSNIIDVEIGTSAQGTAIGTGQANTTAIIAQSGHMESAAQLCEDLSITNGSTTYNDWFLPSKDELNLVYTNLKVAGVGGFNSDHYWNSSENNAYYAWVQNFTNGNQPSSFKNSNLRVRAVRAFRSIAPTYLVNYNANGSTDGTVPSDGYHYEPAENVTVLENTGNLVKTGYTFDGWNTAADGNGTDQAEESTFAMGASDVTLYAKWLQNFTITFDKNDAAATGTMADQTIASGSTENLIACGFTKTGWTFAGWATTSGGTVEYDDGASYTMGTANAILYAKWTPPDTYSLRDIGPAGGYIFYDNGSYVPATATVPSWRYLEAAPSNQSTGAEWGCSGIDISGANGYAVGTGEQNTIEIEAECTTAGTAADICANFSLGVYDDWFLPSRYELNLMYTNLHNIGSPVGGFESYNYWSSSEDATFPANKAWYKMFSNGNQFTTGKNSSDLRVRAVRAF